MPAPSSVVVGAAASGVWSAVWMSRAPTPTPPSSFFSSVSDADSRLLLLMCPLTANTRGLGEKPAPESTNALGSDDGVEAIERFQTVTAGQEVFPAGIACWHACVRRLRVFYRSYHYLSCNYNTHVERPRSGRYPSQRGVHVDSDLSRQRRRRQHAGVQAVVVRYAIRDSLRDVVIAIDHRHLDRRRRRRRRRG